MSKVQLITRELGENLIEKIEEASKLDSFYPIFCYGVNQKIKL